MSPGSVAPLRITYLGHATVLIELASLRILTDPVLRPRVGHLIRRVPVPEPRLLDAIDVVLVSHAHHDHLDASSLRALPGGPRVFCPPAVRRVARRAGLRPTVLVPGATERVGSTSIEATYADHDGRRWPLVGDAGSLGFVVRGDSGAIYFAGDTGLHAGMRKLTTIDVALLPVAGWGPRLGPGHLGPSH